MLRRLGRLNGATPRVWWKGTKRCYWWKTWYRLQAISGPTGPTRILKPVLSPQLIRFLEQELRDRASMVMVIYMHPTIRTYQDLAPHNM